MLEYDGMDYRLPSGEYHRADGPAMWHSDGFHSWYLFGAWHRYYGPRNNKDNNWFIHGNWIK